MKDPPEEGHNTENQHRQISEEQTCSVEEIRGDAKTEDFGEEQLTDAALSLNGQREANDGAPMSQQPSDVPANNEKEDSLVEASDRGTESPSSHQPLSANVVATTTQSSLSPRQQERSDDNKVKVHFVAVGSAPILKQSKFKIDADQKFGYVVSSLRRTLKLTENSGADSSLFLYCNAAFVPSPDERLGDLNDCFSVRGELVIRYSLKEAWG